MFTDVSWREEEEGGFTCTVPLLSGYFSNLQFSDGDTDTFLICDSLMETQSVYL